MCIRDRGFPFSGTANSFTRDLLYDKATNKQFIAIETRNGDLFYMIIDYDKPLDEKGEKYETYFLNLVDSRDLLDIVDAKDIPDEPEVIYVTPEPTEVPTQSPSNEEKADVQKPDSSKTTVSYTHLQHGKKPDRQPAHPVHRPDGSYPADQAQNY